MHLSNTMHDIMKLLKEQRVVTVLYSSVLFLKNDFKMILKDLYLLHSDRNPVPEFHCIIMKIMNLNCIDL